MGLSSPNMLGEPLGSVVFLKIRDKTGCNFLVCEQIAIIRTLARAHGTTLE